MPTDDGSPLAGQVALVAGATRGATRQIALRLARAGAYVYATGRSSRATGPSELGRPETIDDVDETLRSIGDRAGGVGGGVGLRVDHLDAQQVRDLVDRIDREQGRLDVLVIGLFGADVYAQFGDPLWAHDLDGGLRMLRIGIDGHVITAHAAAPLLIRRPGAFVVEMTDGTREYNSDYRHAAGFFYDLTKAAGGRLVLGLAHELPPYGGAAVGVTPGWLRSEAMLDIFGVTEENWRDALGKEPNFGISETPVFVARGVTAMLADGDRSRFNGRVLTSFDLAQEYDVDDVDGSRPDAWRYLVEVQDRGGPPDTTGYR